ncbi:MAG: hypothetical protein QOH30_3653, partial [Baekduia sp.]|nr:hypothetical protein [Baekduia sp.]
MVRRPLGTRQATAGADDRRTSPMICVQDISRDPRAPGVARRMVDDLDGILSPDVAQQARLLV